MQVVEPLCVVRAGHPIMRRPLRLAAACGNATFLSPGARGSIAMRPVLTRGRGLLTRACHRQRDGEQIGAFQASGTESTQRTNTRKVGSGDF
jgi:hypothetical protein